MKQFKKVLVAALVSTFLPLSTFAGVNTEKSEVIFESMGTSVITLNDEEQHSTKGRNPWIVVPIVIGIAWCTKAGTKTKTEVVCEPNSVPGKPPVCTVKTVTDFELEWDCRL